VRNKVKEVIEATKNLSAALRLPKKLGISLPLLRDDEHRDESFFVAVQSASTI
jgi:hypothetical protein